MSKGGYFRNTLAAVTSILRICARSLPPSAPRGGATGLRSIPLYVDTVVRRWQKLTGDIARHGEHRCAVSSCPPSR